MTGCLRSLVTITGRGWSYGSITVGCIEVCTRPAYTVASDCGVGYGWNCFSSIWDPGQLHFFSFSWPVTGFGTLGARCRSLSSYYKIHLLFVFKVVGSWARQSYLQFGSNRHEQCDVVWNSTQGKIEDICRVIAERLDRSQSMPEFGPRTTLRLAAPQVLAVLVDISEARARLRDSTVMAVN